MRLVHIYSGNLYGGVEHSLAAMAAAAPPGVRQTFALAYDGRLRRELDRAGAEVVMIGAARARVPWTIWRARRELAALLKAVDRRGEAPVVVLAHSLWALAVLGHAARGAGALTALYLHNPPTSALWPDEWARRTPIDVAIANSRYTARISQPFVPDVTIECVHPPVAMVEQAGSDRVDVRRELATPPDDVVILQASRMQEWKGHRALVGALSAIQDLTNWTAWIAGGMQKADERAYEAGLRRAVAEAGLGERVRFLGERADVARLARAADVYCQPNHDPEPFGVVFVEALAAGLAVVTTDAGGAREIVATECGRLVPQGDGAALAAALRTLVTDVPLRKSLGAHGPARARSLCDAQTQTARLMRFLRGAAEKGASLVAVPAARA
jgi:glycosyltransferase involved in cell wall biosynthesis